MNWPMAKTRKKKLVCKKIFEFRKWNFERNNRHTASSRLNFCHLCCRCWLTDKNFSFGLDS